MLPPAAAVAGAALAAGDAGAAFSRSVRDEGPMALKLSFMAWLSNAPAVDGKSRAAAGAGAAGARVAARGAAELERGSLKLG